MNDIILPLGDRISIRPRADVTRHRSETVSQYELRLKNDLDHNSNSTTMFTNNMNQNKREQRSLSNATAIATAFKPHPLKELDVPSNDSKPYTNDWFSTPGFTPQMNTDPIPQKNNLEDIYPEFPSSPSSPPLWLEEEERRLNQSTNPLYRKRSTNPLYRNRQGTNSTNRAKSLSLPSGHNHFGDANFTNPSGAFSGKYSRNSTGSNPATRAIAQHYRERYQEQKRSSVTNAIAILAPFLLSCVHWFRKRNQFIACVIIQSVMRGYFIRRDVHHLILFLRFRKSLRMLARLCIRNWVRKRADTVHCVRAARKLAKILNLMPPFAVNSEEFRVLHAGVR